MGKTKFIKNQKNLYFACDFEVFFLFDKRKIPTARHLFLRQWYEDRPVRLHVYGKLFKIKKIHKLHPQNPKKNKTYRIKQF